MVFHGALRRGAGDRLRGVDPNGMPLSLEGSSQPTDDGGYPVARGQVTFGEECDLHEGNRAALVGQRTILNARWSRLKSFRSRADGSRETTSADRVV